MATTKCNSSLLGNGKHMSKDFRYAIALTGSIATGKSTASGIFNTLGFTVIDADSISHDTLDEQHKAVAKLFGKKCVKENKVKRKKLGKLVFKSQKKRKKLEALLHPLIYDKIHKLSKKQDKKKKPYFVDIPLFFESDRYPISKSLLVYTTHKKQLKRLIKRDGYSKKEAQVRINTQISIEKKRVLASYVVNNNKDLKELKKECKRVQKRIEGDFR
jgi:dephospho-CoA kinase